ncbi:hypothetical protein FRC10_003205 [Ceratobasidium sp. 414]|nr:hypothetical protein FRC10_003205 [Ceratobasidium sp. 414]
MLWIRTFLAPSILDVQVVGKPGGEIPLIHIPTAVCLLTHIAKAAPNIQHLSLFIEEERFDRPEEDADMIGFWELPLSDCFENLPTLRTIISTEAVLGADVFRTVTGLAELKTLDIWAHGGFTAIWDELNPKSLPSTPFPALDHFSMRSVGSDEVWTVLGHPVFNNLSSLRLSFHQWPTPEEAGDEPWEYQLIELIAQASPRLTGLNIEFDEDRIQDEPCDLLDPAPNGGTALLSMSKLPLVTVHISSAVLCYLNSNAIRSDDLKLAWPLVTKLNMPRLLAGFEELYKFSQLPNLQDLTLCLNLDEDCLPDDFFERPVGSSSLHTLRGSTQMRLSEIGPDISARALLHCWPKLERVLFHIDADDPPHDDDDDDYDDLMSDIGEINKELQKLRVSQSQDTDNLV